MLKYSVTSFIFAAASAVAQEDPETFEYTARLTAEGMVFAPENPSAVELDRSIAAAREELSRISDMVEATEGVEVEQVFEDEIERIVGLTLASEGQEAVDSLVNSWVESGIEVEVVSGTGQVITAAVEDGGTIAGVSRAALREIAQDAASELFTAAVESACSASIRPTEITPSFTVSFSLFAGAEFSLSATFEIDRVCADTE